MDANAPQKTIPFTISGNKIGSIRYNAEDSTALVDKGLYIVYAAFVMGYRGDGDDIFLASPVGHSRFCFNDE